MDAIKKKFKLLCLLTHPDKNPSAAAVGAFKLVVRAWDAISSSPSTSGASCQSQSSGFQSRRDSTRSNSGSGFPDGTKTSTRSSISSSSKNNTNSGTGPQPGRSAASASEESVDGLSGTMGVVTYCLHCSANSGLLFTFERSGFLDIRIICPSCKMMYRCYMGIRFSSAC